MQGVKGRVSISQLYLHSSKRASWSTEPSCPRFDFIQWFVFALASKLGVDHAVRRSLPAED